MKKEKIISSVQKQKKIAMKCLKRHKYEDALLAISCSARILYETNIYYVDEQLEEMIESVSERVKSDAVIQYKDNKVLFWDGFGFDIRGLAQIYIRALSKEKEVHYVTFSDRKEEIPQIISIVEKSGGEVHFVDRHSFFGGIYQLRDIVEKIQAKHFFFYSFPEDVIATTIMYAYKDKIYRYQINLTDHAFWLGARCIDVCVEFRDYGASISKEYRGIEKERMVKIPFYPVINYERKFEGVPFELKQQQFVFSGGALYKTFGKGNKYYKIVDYIMKHHPQIIFWYAGSGDKTELVKLMERYPNRIYFTEERPDLYQILERCIFYLSTYPISGGLMYQYAALAGKIPLTLRDSEQTEGFLLNQNKLGIQFDDISELYQEIDKVLSDSDYRQQKENNVKEAVISSTDFEKEVKNLLDKRKTSYPININYTDTDAFGEIYLERVTNKDISRIIASNDYFGLFKYEPIVFGCGLLYRLGKKIKQKIKFNKKEG